MSLITETCYDTEQKIWSGPKTARKYAPNTTLGEVILEVLRRDPAKIMQISDATGEEKTAAQLLRDSDGIARYLMSLKLSPGDVVGIYAGNSTNLTAVVIAALLCGTPYNTAFPGFDKGGVMGVYKITTPKIIFCDVNNYDTLKAAVKELELDAKIITVNGKIPGVESVPEILKDYSKISEDVRYPCFDLNGDSTAMILCSSGTTGGPKGVTSSHSRLLELLVFLNISPNDVVFSFSTLFWISGTFTIMGSLLNGATRIITEQPFTPAFFYNLVEKHSITHVLSPTGQIAAMIEDGNPDTAKCLRSIKALLVGGSKVHKSIAEKFVEMLNNEAKFIIAYGLSESGTMISETSQSTTKPIRYDCEGKLMPNIEAQIIDETSGMALGPNQRGSLYTRSPFKWYGYYRNEEATKKAYSKGWLNTGDVAYFDDEGFLHICARNSEVFKSNGFFIFPNMLENLIVQLPGVAEVCVFPKPDLIAGNLTACAIVRTNDETSRMLTEHVVLKHVEQHISPLYHIKGGVHFVDMLPKTASGKVQQRNVYNMCISIKKGNE